MSPGSVWSVLQIAPTSDPTEIRRAYSRRLKVTNPEDDAEGFQTLRAAYDQALTMARYAADRERHEAAATVDHPPLDAPWEDEAAKIETQAPEEPTVWEEAEALGLKPRPARMLKTVPEPEPEPSPSRVEFETVDETAHAELCNRLVELLDTPDSGADQIRAAFDAVLASPALDSMDVHHRTELWFSSMLMNVAPAGDDLLDRVIDYFRWEDPWGGMTIGQAVVARRDGLEAFRSLARQDGFKELTVPPTLGRRLKYRLVPRLRREVGQMLGRMTNHHPEMIGALDPDAMAWWTRYLSRPRYGANSVWTALVLPPLLLALVVVAGAPLPARQIAVGYLVCLAGVIGLQLAWLFGLATPRAWWRRTKADHAPAWLRLGWAPASLLLLTVSGLPAASRVDPLAITVLAAAVALWAFITGEPDTDDETGPGWKPPSYVSLFTLAFYLIQPLVRPGTHLPWQVRAAFSYLYLAIYWAILSMTTPAAVWTPTFIALLGAGAAMTFGAGSLMQFWLRDGSPKVRRGLLIGLGLATAATPLIAYVSPPEVIWAPILVAVLVLVHKAPAVLLSLRSLRIRDAAMRYGGFAWMVAADSPELRQSNGGLFFGAMWLLTGVAITVLGALHAERHSLRR